MTAQHWVSTWSHFNIFNGRLNGTGIEAFFPLLYRAEPVLPAVRTRWHRVSLLEMSINRRQYGRLRFLPGGLRERLQNQFAHE